MTSNLKPFHSITLKISLMNTPEKYAIWNIMYGSHSKI